MVRQHPFFLIHPFHLEDLQVQDYREDLELLWYQVYPVLRQDQRDLLDPLDLNRPSLLYFHLVQGILGFLLVREVLQDLVVHLHLFHLCVRCYLAALFHPRDQLDLLHHGHQDFLEDQVDPTKSFQEMMMLHFDFFFK